MREVDSIDFMKVSNGQINYLKMDNQSLLQNHFWLKKIQNKITTLFYY